MQHFLAVGRQAPGQTFAPQNPTKKAEPNKSGLLNRGNVRFRNSLFFAPLLWLYPNLSFGLGLFRDEPDVFVTLTIFKLQRGLSGKVLQH